MLSESESVSRRRETENRNKNFGNFTPLNIIFLINKVN